MPEKSTMTIIRKLFLFLSLSALTLAQTSPPPVPRPSNPSASPMLADLDRLQAAASQANSDLSYMHIQKWKTDGTTKQQSQANAESIQRNLTAALPALIGSVRNAPQDLGAQFKLYRNLTALYDVFASLTESAGAFGAKSDYEALAQQLAVFDSVRRDLGDSLESLTASTQTEINQLRAQVQTLQQRAAAAATSPKKVVVDDSEPAKKSTKKKKSTQSTSPGASSSSATSTTTPKQQE
jgi:hypothetical protein